MGNRKGKPDLPPKPEKKQEKKKQNSMIGDRIRAGILLSTHLRKIAQEATETDKEGNMITKAEALARLMFKLALGYTEVDIKAGIETIHGPDRGMIGSIWDRIEGRAAPTTDNLAKKRTLPQRVSTENKKRLNDIATSSEE